MKKNKLFWAVSVLAMLGCYGCGDDATAPTTEENVECKADDAARCDESGNFVQSCVSGKWENAEACKNGCVEGACLTDVDEPECQADAAPRCDESSKFVQTCVSGVWQNAEIACKYGCDKGVCKAEELVECHEGDAPRCDESGNYVQTCVSGVWQNADEICGGGCSQGVCQPERVKPECYEDEAPQCDMSGRYVQTCVAGVWTNASEPCSEDKYCDNGKCVKLPIDHGCADGESTCDTAHNSVIMCSGGMQSMRTCNLDGGAPMVCAVVSNKADCKQKCLGSGEGVNEPVCYRNGSLGPLSPSWVVTDTCEKDALGTLYSVERKMEECPGDCIGGKCAPAEIIIEPEPDDCPGGKRVSCSSKEEIITCMSGGMMMAKSCRMAGGRAQMCTIIKGEGECNTMCLGDSAGVNKPVCYQNGSLGPSAPIVSMIDTCEMDDDGRLYSVSFEATTCANGCNRDTGLCE